MWRVWAWRALSLGFAIFSALAWWELIVWRIESRGSITCDGPTSDLGVLFGLAALMCLWIARRTKREADEVERPPTLIATDSKATSDSRSPGTQSDH